MNKYTTTQGNLRSHLLWVLALGACSALMLCDCRPERWEDLQDEKEEREIRQQLDELRLDGSYDHYHKQFLSLSDEDIERLSGWYDAGDLCRPLADAWCRSEAH